ncbi:MAG: flavodoxin family protein [Vallitaleaceae bacterium]|nr:flavodoxin family protein [Vallitaleaceae bacterium]
MKVLLINGSPHEEGSTYTALIEICKVLENEGLETEIFQLGIDPIRGCTGCGGCRKTHRCVYNDDKVNEGIEKIREADALIIGSPVHYAAASGHITSFMDRAFYAIGDLSLKPGAAIAISRRGGSSAALDQLNKYFTIKSMPLVSSQYWNMVYGANASDVLKDEEGMQTMRVLGQNMAWLLRCIEAGKKAGVETPTYEKRAWTNFIR